LPDRIFDAGFESALLFLVAHFHPELDQASAAVDEKLLDFRTDLQNRSCLSAKPIRARRRQVVAAIEDDDFAGRETAGYTAACRL
jgi:hypothetical protein